jgi:hypothetical protein
VRRGELHLTAVGLLAPKLTASNCAELMTAARHRSAEEVRELLADRDPRPEVLPSVRGVPEPSQQAPGAARADAPPGPGWRSGEDPGACRRSPAGPGAQAEVRRDVRAETRSTVGLGADPFTTHTGRDPQGGLEARPRPLRLRLGGRPALQFKGVPGVRPHAGLESNSVALDRRNNPALPRAQSTACASRFRREASSPGTAPA